MNELFRRFAHRVSRMTGHAYAFALALVVVVVWFATGPFFGFSDTWQLVINTSTTIVTFLMVFVLQNTQERDNTAVQLKLDELLRAMHSARNRFVDIEDVSDAELESLVEEFRKMHEAVQAERETRGQRVDTA